MACCMDRGIWGLGEFKGHVLGAGVVGGLSVDGDLSVSSLRNASDVVRVPRQKQLDCVGQEAQLQDPSFAH